MKRGIGLCMISGLMILTSCGGNPVSKEAAVPKSSHVQSPMPDRDEGAQENLEDKEPYAVVLSTEEKEVVYNGDVSFTSDAFAANAEYLFLYQSSASGEKGLYRMAIGSDRMDKMNIAIPQDKEVYGMVSDGEGQLHLILKTKQEETTRYFEIWKISQEGELAGQIDITPHVSQSTSPPWLWAIDQQGNYYLRIDLPNADVILIDRKGSVVQEITFEDLGCEISSMGRGRDGKVYAILSETARDVLGVIDADTGNVQRINESVLPEGQRWNRTLGAGTDTELLIYARELGLFACEPNTGKWEQRVGPEQPEEDKKVTGIRYFLPDGRFLRIKIVNDGKGNREESIFHYLAGGR